MGHLYATCRADRRGCVARPPHNLQVALRAIRGLPIASLGSTATTLAPSRELRRTGTVGARLNGDALGGTWGSSAQYCPRACACAGAPTSMRAPRAPWVLCAIANPKRQSQCVPKSLNGVSSVMAQYISKRAWRVWSVSSTARNSIALTRVLALLNAVMNSWFASSLSRAPLR